jgi:hypothetical protein
VKRPPKLDWYNLEIFELEDELRTRIPLISMKQKIEDGETYHFVNFLKSSTFDFRQEHPEPYCSDETGSGPYISIFGTYVNLILS